MKNFISKNYLPLIIFILALFLIAPLGANALKLQIDYPKFAGIDLNEVDFDDPAFFADFLKYIYYFFLSIGGILTFVMLVWGGFKWLTSAGNPGGIGEAKDIIFSALIGLVLLLGSYLILSTINPSLVVIQVPGLTSPGTPGASGSDVLFYSKPYFEGDLRWFFNSGDEISDTPDGDVLSMKIRKYNDAVAFYENENYQGKKMCFQESVDDLTQYGWVKRNDIRDDVRSLRVVTDKDCPSPEVIFPPTGSFSDIMVFYNGVNYQINDRDDINKELRSFSETFEESSEGAGMDVLSIALKPGTKGVKLWENGPGNGKPSFTGKNVCFTNSVPDITIYAFGSTDIRDDIRSFEIIDDKECYNPGVIVSP